MDLCFFVVIVKGLSLRLPTFPSYFFILQFLAVGLISKPHHRREESISEYGEQSERTFYFPGRIDSFRRNVYP